MSVVLVTGAHGGLGAGVHAVLRHHRHLAKVEEGGRRRGRGRLGRRGGRHRRGRKRGRYRRRCPHRVGQGVSHDVRERFAAGRARPESAERLYSPEEAAEYLGVHVQTVRGWIRSGRLRASRLAGQRALRIRASDLLEVLEPIEPGDA